MQAMLPVDEDGNPDYFFMESYVSDKRGGLLMRYKTFLENQLDELEHVDIPALSEKEWETFEIGKLFTITKVTGRPSGEYSEGTLPYISTSATNNGLVTFVKATDEACSKSNSISVDPIKGTCFYHPYIFVGRGFSGASINLLSSEKLNEYIGLFISTAIQNSAKDNASYSHLFNGKRLSKGQVLLPVRINGDPDWDYMEQYTKNMMLKKYKQYLAFLDNQEL